MDLRRKMHSRSFMTLGFVCPKCHWYQTVRASAHMTYLASLEETQTTPKLDLTNVIYDCPHCSQRMRRVSWYMAPQIAKLLELSNVDADNCRTEYDSIKPNSHHPDRALVTFPSINIEDTHIGLLAQIAERLADEPNYTQRIYVRNTHVYDDLTPPYISLEIGMYGSDIISYDVKDAPAVRQKHRELFMEFLNELIKRYEEGLNNGN